MSDELPPSQGPEKATAERRDARRYSFICPAELMELGGSARILARTADLSLQGCYIDTLNPFPLETRVHLQLTKNNQRLELQARVTVCHMGSGMGLMFEQLTPEQNATLLAWLEGTPSRDENPFRSTASADVPQGAPKTNARFAAELVKILERKGILTHSEAAELLRGLDS
jgi:hypothetical protein